MSTRLRWLVSQSASSLHAAAAIVRGQTLVDAEVAAALAEPAAELHREMQIFELPESRFWRILCALATTFDNNRQLAKMAAYRTLGQASPQQLSERIGGRISDLEAALRRLKPDLLSELMLRAKPMREQWEARGPGMLRQLASITEERLLVDCADVVLVVPVLGGGGEAQLQNNSVRIEALLANPHERLPEIVRIAWMLSQLHLDLPLYAEEMPAERIAYLAALAMIPPTLAAAQHVELSALSDEMVQFAIDAWQVPTSLGVETVDVLMRWWEAYAESRPPFEVAFKALDEMLE